MLLRPAVQSGQIVQKISSVKYWGNSTQNWSYFVAQVVQVELRKSIQRVEKSVTIFSFKYLGTETVSEILHPQDSFQKMQFQGLISVDHFPLSPQPNVSRPARIRDFCLPEFKLDTNVGVGMMLLQRTG